MATVESSGVAKAGLTTGIIGTSLAGLWALGAGNGNGLLGGLFGGNRCGGYGMPGDMAAQGLYQAAISSKDAEIGQLKAERYADQVGIGVYQNAINLSNRNDEKINQNLKEAFQELVVTRERLATADANFKCLAASVDRIGSNVNDLNAEVANMRVREQATSDAIDCLAKNTHDRFASVYGMIDSKVALEAERRECGDQRLFEYVNCNYIKAQKKIARTDICPEVMPRYNSWVAPTEEAPSTQPITGSVSVTRSK